MCYGLGCDDWCLHWLIYLYVWSSVIDFDYWKIEFVNDEYQILIWITLWAYVFFSIPIASNQSPRCDRDSNARTRTLCLIEIRIYFTYEWEQWGRMMRWKAVHPVSHDWTILYIDRLWLNTIIIHDCDWKKYNKISFAFRPNWMSLWPQKIVHSIINRHFKDGRMTSNNWCNWFRTMHNESESESCHGLWIDTSSNFYNEFRRIDERDGSEKTAITSALPVRNESESTDWLPAA